MATEKMVSRVFHKEALVLLIQVIEVSRRVHRMRRHLNFLDMNGTVLSLMKCVRALASIVIEERFRG